MIQEEDCPDKSWASLATVLRQTSRTFALGIERLPHDLRQEVTIAYLVLRVSDYLEDNEVMSPDARAQALETWAAILEGRHSLEELQRDVAIDHALVDSQAVVHAASVLWGLAQLSPRAREAVQRHTVDSTRGMARWVRHGPEFPTEASLDDYMHEVAGRVGYLLTDLFSIRYPALGVREGVLSPLAREFGLGLQTVNVVRGLSTDHRRGWVFVPRAYLPAGTEPAQLFAMPRNDAVALDALHRLASKADRHLEHALQYIELLPLSLHRVRIFCALPVLLAVRTLALSRGSVGVFGREIKVPRSEVTSITRRVGLVCLSNRWLRAYTGSLGLV